MSTTGQSHDGKREEGETMLTVYKTGTSPTIDLQLLDGTRMFIHYGHLIKGRLSSDETHQVITLFTSTDTVTIKGFALTPIYDALRQHTVTIIRANDPRYLHQANDSNSAFVIDIEVTGH